MWKNQENSEQQIVRIVSERVISSQCSRKIRVAIKSVHKNCLDHLTSYIQVQMDKMLNEKNQ